MDLVLDLVLNLVLDLVLDLVLNLVLDLVLNLVLDLVLNLVLDLVLDLQLQIHQIQSNKRYRCVRRGPIHQVSHEKAHPKPSARFRSKFGSKKQPGSRAPNPSATAK